MGIFDTTEKKADFVDEQHSEDGQPTYANQEGVPQGLVEENSDLLQRRLGNRQIQLIAIGGSIGTALFVSIGSGLLHGGPGSLFIAYLLYSCMLGLVNNCMAEMTILMPVSGGFIRMAGKWVDDAFGFMAGWNFFLYEALLIPFEITALNLVLSFWFGNTVKVIRCSQRGAMISRSSGPALERHSSSSRRRPTLRKGQ